MEDIPSVEAWPQIEYEDGYPIDEDFAFWVDNHNPLISFHRGARWILDELPRAAENMACFCKISDGHDIADKPVKLVNFSTGGWSGAESIIALINRRFDLNHFMLSWERGGNYVFEIPLYFLSDSDGNPKGEDGEAASSQSDDSAGRKASPETQSTGSAGGDQPTSGVVAQ